MAPSTTNTPASANVAGATSQTFSQRKQNAAFLATQYTTTKRAGEIISVSLSLLLLIGTFVRLFYHGMFTLEYSWLIVTSCLLSMVFADLFSGLLHWGADTWGSFDTPLFGKTFIRSFREHHVDPVRMTQHDFVETNGDNFMVIAPFLAYLAFGVEIREGSYTDCFLVNFLLYLCVWVALTNQIHKWAHLLKPPRMVALLQDFNIILSRKDHQVHHHTPFDRYYCITNGWLNPILGAIGFWKRMEIAISAITGAVPRQDDAYWTVQFKGELSTQEGEHH